ncbi:MAG: DUF6287 domain-containing protein [Streptococcaceae bacterium]|jgi:hypothetical protein|nr:DUF6287 domain-containing protein [Streptococcaceae bacterium]
MKKFALATVILTSVTALSTLTACGGNKSTAVSSSKSSSSSSSKVLSSSSKSSSTSTNSSVAVAQVSMNSEQIANGDFSSVVGTWKNAKGQTLTVTKDMLSFSDILGTYSQPEAGTVTGSKIDIPDWNDATGNPKIVQGVGSMEPAYQQNITISQGTSTNDVGNPTGAIFVDQISGAVIEIVFTPKGAEAFTNGQVHEADQSDKSKDRIWSFATQGGLDSATLAQNAYYKQ